MFFIILFFIFIDADFFWKKLRYENYYLQEVQEAQMGLNGQ